MSGYLSLGRFAGLVPVTLILAGLAAGCASQPPQGAEPDAEPVAEADPSAMQAAAEKQPPPTARKVCRVERVTGSNMHRRRCFTEAELREMSDNAQEWLRTRGTSGGPHMVRDEADPRDQ